MVHCSLQVLVREILECEDGYPMENVGHDGGKGNRGANKE
jgi:hypothetical protein